MKLRDQICMVAVAALTSGCSFISGLVSAGGADASAFNVNMERYDIKSIDLRGEDIKDGLCPGASIPFRVVATAIDKKKSQEVFLETASAKAKGAEANGKMDPTEFAWAARGGTIENGVFTSNPDPFAVLLGFDVKVIYRVDKTKEAVRHYMPVYGCIRSAGGSGPSGPPGLSGRAGSSNGGAGGSGGDGVPGTPGPQLTAYVSIVKTPVYDRVGILRVSGTYEQLTLFDIETGIIIAARGGNGGRGGAGGQGGRGADRGGTGGPGGAGGDGGDGADGGHVVIVIDDRFPELGQVVQADVSGGSPGSAGPGGGGGPGGTPPQTCSGCKSLPPGANGPSGPGGNPGTVSGRDGTMQVRKDDVLSVFAELPPGIRLRDEPRPEPVYTPPPPEPTPTKGKRKPKPV